MHQIVSGEVEQGGYGKGDDTANRVNFDIPRMLYEGCITLLMSKKNKFGLKE
jgi:hypothetical protein